MGPIFITPKEDLKVPINQCETSPTKERIREKHVWAIPKCLRFLETIFAPRRFDKCC